MWEMGEGKTKKPVLLASDIWRKKCELFFHKAGQDNDTLAIHTTFDMLWVIC